MQKLTDEDRIQAEWDACMAVHEFIVKSDEKWVELYYQYMTEARRAMSDRGLITPERSSDEVLSPARDLINASRVRRGILTSFPLTRSRYDEFTRLVKFEGEMFRVGSSFTITDNTRLIVSYLVESFVEDRDVSRALKDELTGISAVTRDIVHAVNGYGRDWNELVFERCDNGVVVHCSNEDQKASLAVPYIEAETKLKCTVSVSPAQVKKYREQREVMDKEVNEVMNKLRGEGKWE